MGNKDLKYIVLGLIIIGVIIMGFSLFGGRKPFNSPVSGGKVDRTDHTAPKVIKSRNISSLNVSFYIEHRMGGDDDYTGFYHFLIEDGVLSEDKTLNISEKIDAALTEKIQQLIEKHALVKKNGYDKHTAGLPPEYQPCYFTAKYDSGEKLYFSENNNPDAPWALDLFELLREAFIEMGHSELKPSKEAVTITQFQFYFNIGSVAYEYSPVDMGEDGYQLMKRTSKLGVDNSAVTELSDLDDDLYEGLFQLVSNLNLKIFHTGGLAVSSDCPHTEDGYYEIYIDFENGKQIYGYSTDSEMVEDFQKDAGSIAGFFDNYMSEHGNHVHEW